MTNDLPKRTQRLIHFWATEVLKHPPEEREAVLVRIKEENYDSARRASPQSEASAWADKMDEFTRVLIEIIEESRGASGGTA